MLPCHSQKARALFRMLGCMWLVLCAGFAKSKCLPKKRPAPTGDDTRGPMGLKLSGKSLDEKKVMARCCLSYISGVKNHLSLVCGSI